MKTINWRKPIIFKWYDQEDPDPLIKLIKLITKPMEGKEDGKGTTQDIGGEKLRVQSMR